METVEKIFAQEDNVDAVLAHFGVKGMKWGVRKANEQGGGTIAKPVNALLTLGTMKQKGNYSKNYARGYVINMGGSIGAQYSAPIAYRYTTAQALSRPKLKSLNKEYSTPGKNLGKNRKLQDAYDKQYQKIVQDAFNRAPLVAPPGTSATYKSDLLKPYKFDFYMQKGLKNERPYLRITSASGKSEDFKLGVFKTPKVKHADLAEPQSYMDFEVMIDRDENGYITDWSVPSFETLEQSDTVDDVLAHFGVKGMRWGVRKRTASKQHQNGPKSDQAAKVADIIKNIQKNGIGAATNDDLKMLEQRIKLEAKYKEMFPPKKTLLGKGLEVTQKILWDVGEKQANAYLSKQVGGFVNRAPLVGAPKKQVDPKVAQQAVKEILKKVGNTSVSSVTSDVNFGYM